jgi:DNA-3-methyladenine glycosylase II
LAGAPAAEPLRVELPAPLDIGGSLELFRRSGDDLIDRWDGTRLLRAAPLDAARSTSASTSAKAAQWTPFSAVARGSVAEPAFDIVAYDHAHLDTVRRTVQTTFTALPDGWADLLARDPVIAKLDAKFPGIRQIRQLELFTALVRCISAQQVNLRWAVVTRRRLAEAFGTRHALGDEVVYSLDPARLAEVDPAEIRALQFTTSKAVSIVEVARTLAVEGLSSESFDGASDDEVIQNLVRIKGIGRWSAEWVLARTLGRPCVVAGDLGVRKAVGLVYLDDPRAPEMAVRAATAHWGDAAGVAQALLLHALGEGALSLEGLRDLRS